jgi:hypothetical protein
VATTPGAEVGGSGLLTSTSGEVLEELHPNLYGRKAIETWRLMKDHDALVGAILFAIEMLVRQVEWRVDQEDAKEEEAEFLESCLHDMSHSWGDFICEALSMLPFGFAFHEAVYKQRRGEQPEGGKLPSSKFSDGKVGWRKLPLRAQETLDRWEFDDDGGIKAFVQKPPPDYTDRVIPMVKGLLFRTTSYKNNPEGRSVLRSAYASWYYKKRIQQIEGTGIERDLAGFPVFWLPAEFLADDASPAHKQVVNAFDTLGKNIRRDKQEYLIMPLAFDDRGNKAYDFTLTSSGGTRAFDTSAIIERYNKEIAMSVMADFILLGHENVGSFALSSDKTDLFAVALGTFLDIIEDVLNRYAVPRLWRLNGMKTENLPKIAHGDIEKPNLAELGTFIGALVNAGVPLFPDEDLEAYLREVAGLPEKSEETKKAQEEAREEEEADAAAGADGGGGAGGADPIGDLERQQAGESGGSGSGAGAEGGTS